jgi:hypothetical protein
MSAHINRRELMMPTEDKPMVGVEETGTGLL